MRPGISWAAEGVLAALLVCASGSRAYCDTASVGTPQNGTLVGGFQIPLTGAYHQFYGPVKARGTNYATLETAALLARAARVVEGAVPGAPLVVADCSDQDGGKLSRHRSHTSGRDVDVLFYIRDAKGRSRAARGFYEFDAEGQCKPAAKGNRSCSDEFDVQRNWWFVRTLLLSERPAVQYVFVADHLKERMLRYAKARGEHREVLRRARVVLHQPADSTPHADHFHIRLYCSAEDEKQGCRDVGSRWSWLSRTDEPDS